MPQFKEDKLIDLVVSYSDCQTEFLEFYLHPESIFCDDH